MTEIRQAAVLGVLACAVALASACSSDDTGGANGGGAAGLAGGTHAGSGGLGGTHAGSGGLGATGGTPSGGAAGFSAEAGSVDSGGAAGSAGETSDAGSGGSAGGESAEDNGGATGGDPLRKVVFATSVGFTGDFGGVTGADAKCQELADAAHLTGTFKAWLSGADLNSSPSVRFTHSSVPYVLLDQSVIADDWADLTDGTLQHAINLTEKYQEVSFFAFTFTLADGTPGLAGSINKTCYSGNNCNCDNWTNGEATGNPTPGSANGQEYATDSKWTDYSFGNFCGGADIGLYCFEQ